MLHLFRKNNRLNGRWGEMRWGALPILVAYSAAVFYNNPPVFFSRKSVSLNAFVSPRSISRPVPVSRPQNAVQRPARPQGPIMRETVLVVNEGDTLTKLLTSLGVSPEQGTAAAGALLPHINPREFQIGTKIQVRYKTPAQGAETPLDLQYLSFSPEMGSEIQLNQTKGGEFEAKKLRYRLNKRQVAVEGEIKISLYQDALKQGVNANILQKIIRVLSYKFDFQRDFQKGDTFKFFYEETWDSKRGESRPDTFLFAAMTLGGVTHKFYQFKQPGSLEPEFFDEKGQALRQTFLRTPVDGAHLSSAFGHRRHPILGYTKMHKGVDFAAPRGTPVMAAGSGVVVRASSYGAYGNYILIRHSANYQTAYAHLHHYASGIRPGVKVSQGQVIATVGTTGRSTGPHLHFELIKNGQQINPKSISQLPSLVLRGPSLEAFRKYTQKMTQAYYAQVSHKKATCLRG